MSCMPAATWDARRSLARAATDAWVTLQDHVRWRYLVDLEGTGWSGRLKLLPFAGRPVRVWLSWAPGASLGCSEACTLSGEKSISA